MLDCRKELQDRLDLACFNILRDMNGHMDLLDFRSVVFSKMTKRFSLVLWSSLNLPRSSREIYPKPNLDFTKEVRNNSAVVRSWR